MFDLVQPPLTCVEARMCLLEFVSTIRDAITSLRERKIAHLDIRLENICFDVNSSKALLIDVDRSVKYTLLEHNEDYRHTEPTSLNCFLKKLVEEGICDETLHDQWVQEQN